ncbi:thioesterase, FlK family [Hydrogenophaga taeniospiralis]|uniref:thioesterase, FlK family n=1 Tax=Hydrogenophaga taeniospiralis TaxID=65656 RepID=UPI001CFA864A|nr:DsbA family protein [Hydrogenophaga taeniospiralis]UCU92351.1 DsbA family protein [Hydrogenophaga taeniospiralis]
MRSVVVGRMGLHQVVPGPESTAAAIGNDGVQVVSSPYLVGMLEEASHRAVRDLFECGEATVGTRIDVSHLAPALPGREVSAQAQLQEIQGRRLAFAVSAHQDGRVIMRGVHERALVQLDRFLAPAPPDKAPMAAQESPIEFFFDYHSPWCYFAALRIGAIARRLNREVIWRPMHLARLIERIDGRRPLEANAAFVRWFKADMQLWARQLGLELRYHPAFPLRPVRALRATVFAAQHGRAESFVSAVMRAYWSESRDISDLDQLTTLGVAAGLDARAVRDSIDDPMFKKQVETNTQEAQDRGVFGAPSFFCDDQLFWGNDRLDQLEAFASCNANSKSSPENERFT